MKYIKKVVGERLYLSPINVDDFEKYTEWVNDLDVTLNLTMAHQIISTSMERELLEKLAKEGCIFGIINKSKDELIGNISLMNINSVQRTAELGIFIGNKDYWSKGYGSEAIKLLLNFGFDILNLNNIMLRVKSFNKRAIKCYEKCGFKMIGKRREAFICGDKKFDEYSMDILASEFKTTLVDQVLKRNHNI